MRSSVQGGPIKSRGAACLGSRCQSLATLTRRSRNTGVPSSASICLRERVPTDRSRSPPLPMTIAFWLSRSTKSHGVDVEQRSVVRAALAQLHLLDDDGDRVGELVAYAFQRGLAHDLGNQGLLRLVRQVTVGIQLGAFGEQPDQQLAEQVDLGAADRRHRHDLREVRQGGHLEQTLTQPSRPTRSVFVTTATLVARPVSAISLAIHRSPGPTFSFAGTHSPTTSTCASVSRTMSLSRSPSSVRGRCSPGVSTSTSCPARGARSRGSRAGSSAACPR